jgi:hypothetical protein
MNEPDLDLDAIHARVDAEINDRRSQHSSDRPVPLVAYNVVICFWRAVVQTVKIWFLKQFKAWI